MKTKKILSGVLVVLMLFSVFSVVAFAADEGTTEKPLKYTFTLTSGPSKTEYYDYEKFDPNGIAVTVTDATTGSTIETVYYSDDISYRFTFSPSSSAYLRAENEVVGVTLDGQFVGETPVKVSHRYEPDTCLGKTKHGTKCFGCGDVQKDTIADHTYDDEKWVANGDATFTRDETESNFCTVCGYEIKRDIDGTADYDVEFEEYQFLRNIMVYIEMLLDMIYGSILR